MRNKIDRFADELSFLFKYTHQVSEAKNGVVEITDNDGKTFVVTVRSKKG